MSTFLKIAKGKMIVESIVNWCNGNSGFVSAILSVMTIFISVLALISSKRVGTIPYKKKLTAIPTYYEKDGTPVIEIMIVNYGFTALVIDYIFIKDKKRTVVGCTSMMRPIIIKPSEYETITVTITDHNGLIGKHAIDLNKNVTIAIREYGGKIHKFRKGFPVG